jgi:DNA-binding IclR family transcriptional regulator
MNNHSTNSIPRSDPKSGQGRFVKSDETLLAIIEYLKREGTANLTDIAKELELANSSVHRHLVTLKHYGFITQENTQYCLGLRFLEIGEIARRNRPIYHVCNPKISKLAETTGEVATCIIEENNLGVFLCFDKGEQAAAHDAWPGKPMHLHYLSGGLCMMAFMSDAKVQEIIEQHGLPEKTPNTITTEEELFSVLEEIREQKFYIDNGESVRGLSTVSVPILDESDKPVAGLTVGGPQTRFTKSYCEDEILPAIQTIANEIELDIKFGDFR